MAVHATNHFDVAYVADYATLRHCAEWITEEIAVHVVAGYTTVIVPIPDGAPTGNHSIGERIAWCSHRGWAEVIDPNSETLSATLAIFPIPVESPLNEELPTLLLKVDCALVVVDGSPLTPCGSIRSEVERAATWVESMGPGHTEWVTTSEDTRAELEQSAYVTPARQETWEPVFHPRHWKRKNRCPAGDIPVLGRHAMPLSDWWPSTLEEFLKFYPISRHVRVKLLGAQKRKLQMLGGRPRDWTFFPYGSVSVRRFLRRIDFFVECKPPGRTPLIKANLLGAMASGVVPVICSATDTSFGDAVVTCNEPADVLEEALALYRVTESYRAQAERSRQFVFDNHGPIIHINRLHRLIGAPRSRIAVPVRPQPMVGESGAEQSSVLLVTSNGVGIGHVTRMLAIARRLPSCALPVFATMSPAISIIRREGFHAEYIPFHNYAKCSASDWNQWLYAELLRLIRFFRSRVVVFDGHFPYRGICDALSCDPEVVAVWCRRAMWTRAVWDEAIDRTKFFDLVIEPGELAAKFDVGATVPHRGDVQIVEPITLLNECDLLSPDDARRTLGLDNQRTSVLLQLSSGNHINIVPVIEQILSTLSRIGDFEVTVAEWPNSDYKLDQWAGVRRLGTYPHAKYYGAFDFVISACGYNSFHELVRYGIPTIFIPVELSFLDNQLARANFAAERSLGLCLRFSELSRLEEAVIQILNPDVREGIRRSCSFHRAANGANAAADIITGLLS